LNLLQEFQINPKQANRVQMFQMNDQLFQFK